MGTSLEGWRVTPPVPKWREREENELSGCPHQFIALMKEDIGSQTTASILF